MARPGHTDAAAAHRYTHTWAADGHAYRRTDPRADGHAEAHRHTNPTVNRHANPTANCHTYTAADRHADTEADRHTHAVPEWTKTQLH